MKNLFVSLCLAAATISFSASAGTHDVRMSTAPDRVRTPLEVGMKRIGTIAQRSVSEIPGETNWRLGCEVLDRDYVDFDEYKEPVFVFWDAMSDTKAWARPGDGFETRPMTFRYTGKPLKNPVWVDLMTGRVYKFPKENQLISEKSIRFVDVPVYDSPCILTERSAIKFRRK